MTSMKNLLIPIAVCLLSTALPAWAKKDAPSRPAEKGCKWEKINDATLGLDVWVQRCDFGDRKIDLYAKQNALMMRYSDGGEPEALIETFDVSAGESGEAAIKRIFAEKTPDKDLVARCVLKPYRDEPVPPGQKRYTFQPTPALQKELDKKTDPGDIPEPPCGDWGFAPDSVDYWEFQPANSTDKVMFVRAGQDEPMFDEKTLRLLPAQP